MTSEIVKVQFSRPALATGADRELLAGYTNALTREPPGHYSISDRRAPNAVDHHRLRTRLDELAAALRGATPAQVASRIIRLFALFPSSAGMTEKQVEAMVSAYAANLSKFPLWAVDAACLDVVRSGAKFAPSAPELIELAEGHCVPFREEQGAIGRVLNAEVYHEPSDEERARISARFDQLLADLRLNEVYDRPRSDWKPPASLEEANERLAHLAGLPIPKLSDEALHKLGMRPPARQSEDAA